MIIIGIENCKSCKVAKEFLKDIPYIELSKEIKNDQNRLKIKKALKKHNPTNYFPVIFNDSLTKMIDSKFIMKNLSKKKIEEKMTEI